MGLTAQAAEGKAGVPAAFISKAKRGGREGPAAEASWAALRAMLEREGALSSVVAPVVAPVEPAAAPGGAPVVVQASSLVAAIRAADSLTALDGLAQQVLEELAAERVSATVARALIEIIKERRQLLAAISAEKDRLDGEGPVVVRVIWTDERGEAFDWRPVPGA